MGLMVDAEGYRPDTARFTRGLALLRVGWRAGHRQNLAVGHVHHQGGPRDAVALEGSADGVGNPLERVLGSLLKLHVQGEDDVGACLRLHRCGVLEHRPVCVHVHVLLAADALQRVLVLQLETRLAHRVTSLVHDGVLVAALLALLELFGRHGPRIANHMRRETAVRIGPYRALLDRHALKEIGVLANEGHDTPGHVGCHQPV